MDTTIGEVPAVNTADVAVTRNAASLKTAGGNLLLTTVAGGRLLVPTTIGVIDAGRSVDKGALKQSLGLTVSLAGANAFVVIGTAIIPVIESFSAIAESLEV